MSRALNFNALLQDEGIDPREVRLLRHSKSKKFAKNPYAVWRENPDDFEKFQRTQDKADSAVLKAQFWAGFVVDPAGKTLFVGLYAVKGVGAYPCDWIDPVTGESVSAFSNCDFYSTQLQDALRSYAGRLFIEWGEGRRSRIQKAVSKTRQDKYISELHERFQEPTFPGYFEFWSQLSEILSLPPTWKSVLSSSKGVYLLTCPETKEQYVGSATGQGGFLERWIQYVVTGHGGNIGLRSRDPSDYRVSILQVAGSNDTWEDVLAMENRWKEKLQSREMGLNRN